MMQKDKNIVQKVYINYFNQTVKYNRSKTLIDERRKK